MDAIRKLRSPWVIVTLLLATYVGSYFGVSDYEQKPYAFARPLTPSEVRALTPEWNHKVRTFKRKWMLYFYRPMIYVESKVRGEQFVVWVEGY